VKSTIDVTPFVRLFSRFLRDRGLPVTQQRESVAEVVFSSDAHLSVDEIEGELRTGGERIGKATIYRTLDLLVRSKLVEEHDFGEGFKRYEHRLSNQPVHEHLICTNCGAVVEFRSPEVQALEQSVAQVHGFKPVRHRLEVYGICGRCQSEGAVMPDPGLICPIDND